MAECTLVAPHLTWLRALASSPIGLTAGLDRARDFPASSKTPVPASALSWLSIAVPTRKAHLHHHSPPAAPSDPTPITCTRSHTPSTHQHNHHVGLRADQGRQELRSRTVSLHPPPVPPQSRPRISLACLLHCLLFSTLITSCCPLHLISLPFLHHQKPTPPTNTMVTRPTPTTANAMDSRTPQNTPAQNAPISSRAQAPSVSDIKEGWSSPTIIEPRTGQPTDSFHRHRGP